MHRPSSQRHEQATLCAVDLYGKVNALPKLINNKSLRTRPYPTRHKASRIGRTMSGDGRRGKQSLVRGRFVHASRGLPGPTEPLSGPCARESVGRAEAPAHRESRGAGRRGTALDQLFWAGYKEIGDVVCRNSLQLSLEEASCVQL